MLKLARSNMDRAQVKVQQRTDGVKKIHGLSRGSVLEETVQARAVKELVPGQVVEDSCPVPGQSSHGSSLTRRISPSPGSSSDGGASPTRHGNVSATGERSADDDFANAEGEQSIIDGIVASIAEPSTADGVDHGGQSGEMLWGNLFSQINTPAAGTGPGQAWS